MGKNMKVARLDVVALGLTAMLSGCMSTGRSCSPEVDATLGPYVERGEIAGVISVLSDRDYNEIWNCFGWADAENKVPMRPDKDGYDK